MKLLPYLFRTSRREILLVAALGLVGGLSSAGLVAVVNEALHFGSDWSLMLGAFIVVALVKIGSGLLSNVLLLQMTQGCVLQMCNDMCRRVIGTPLRRLEEVGTPRILACLTDDVTTLSSAIQAIPPLTINLAILAGCGVYLAFVSWTAALTMLVCVAVGASCYRILLSRAHEAFQRARVGRDTLFRHFRALTEGIKELKLNRMRRETFLREDIGRSVEYLRGQNVVAVKQYMVADAWSQLVFYALLAVLLFALPAIGGITPQALTAYVFTALFTATPVWGIIGALPVFHRGQAALERLEELGLSLSEGEGRCEDAAVTCPRAPRLEFERVEFAYEDAGNGGGFTLGPLDLELNAGELVFVIGGNGSGKSTFVKILTGLYTPRSGEIRVDGERVDTTARESYRGLFSAVYSDFYLFDRLPGVTEDEIQLKAREYLLALQLAHKVHVEGGTLSTTALSQGQRRRLALLMAYMEDRPIYVLDEWAADQDPTFRQVFYTRLLPELKRKGKTVVVITHDDRYFHLGDRIVKLDYGKIAEYRGAEISSSLCS